MDISPMQGSAKYSPSQEEANSTVMELKRMLTEFMGEATHQYVRHEQRVGKLEDVVTQVSVGHTKLREEHTDLRDLCMRLIERVAALEDEKARSPTSLAVSAAGIRTMFDLKSSFPLPEDHGEVLLGNVQATVCERLQVSPDAVKVIQAERVDSSRIRFRVQDVFAANLVVDRRRGLRGSGLTILDVLSPEEKVAHQRLWPVFKEAQRMGKRASFVRARLYIDGKVYYPEQHQANMASSSSVHAPAAPNVGTNAAAKAAVANAAPGAAGPNARQAVQQLQQPAAAAQLGQQGAGTKSDAEAAALNNRIKAGTVAASASKEKKA